MFADKCRGKNPLGSVEGQRDDNAAPPSVADFNYPQHTRGCQYSLGDRKLKNKSAHAHTHTHNLQREEWKGAAENPISLRKHQGEGRRRTQKRGGGYCGWRLEGEGGNYR